MANPPPAQGMTRGRLEQLPCPHCGKPNDCSEVRDMLADGFSQHGHGALPGSTLDCDHCGRFFQIVKVEKITILTARQAQGQRPSAGRPQPVQQPRRSFLDRLLGKG